MLMEKTGSSLLLGLDPVSPSCPFLPGPQDAVLHPHLTGGHQVELWKILFDRTGQPYRRYAPSVEPTMME